MALFVVAVLGGLAVLTVSADQFVVGSARLARALRISPIVVGVVVMGFGTSAPEMVVSAFAAADGERAIAVGNIVGSCLANITFLLGVGALVTSIGVSSVTVRREAPLALVAALAYWLLVQGGTTRWQGGLLMVGLVVTLGLVLRSTGREDPLAAEVDQVTSEGGDHPVGWEGLRTLAGLAGTLVGAQILLYGATNIADELGLSEGFVGVTLVAVGTSLPELVTVVQSARRREVDLIVGNLLGSNIFNVLAVGGIAMLVGPGPVGDASLTGLGMGLVVGVTALVWWFMRTELRVSRAEGITLIVVYAGCIGALRI